MTTQEILEGKLEGNKLIAEFMGYTQHPKYENLMTKPNSLVNWKKGLKYESSWDWLMPVVGTISGIEYKGAPKYWDKITEENEITFALYGNEIKLVYEAVVQFIKWYNKQ